MSMQFVNIAIVLVAMYVALALACSWIQEQIAAIFRLRSSTLESGIAALVANDVTVVGELAKHPLITSGANRSTMFPPYFAEGRFPSYIDKRNFSLAYWQAIATAAGEDQSKLAQLDPKTALSNLVGIVNAWTPTAGSSAEKAQRSAVALLTSAQGDYEKLLAATDDWFDSQMDRVSGWYKRTAQYIMLVIAFALAFGTGFDTIDVARQLFAQPEVANALAQSEAETIKHQNGSDDIGAVAQVLLESQQLQTVRLFWWSPEPNAAAPVTQPTVGERIAGLLLTFIAIALGAPFWFDILKTIVNVRNAGDKPPNDPSSTASNARTGVAAAPAGSP